MARTEVIMTVSLGMGNYHADVLLNCNLRQLLFPGLTCPVSPERLRPEVRPLGTSTQLRGAKKASASFFCQHG